MNEARKNNPRSESPNRTARAKARKKQKAEGERQSRDSKPHSGESVNRHRRKPVYSYCIEI